MRGASYGRYSTDMQDQASIEAQLEANQKFADENGIKIVKTYVDEAYTGKTDNRPDFINMIDDSKKNLFDCVIVHKVDRFARDKYDSAIYKAQLRRRGLKIFYSGQPLTDNAEGRLMEGILESFAQYYSENLATEVMKGMKINAKDALFNGGYAPLGYKIVEGKYEIEEHEAKAVRLIFEMHAVGKSYSYIIEELNRMGYKTRFGNEFKKNSLYSILHNIKYIGTYTFNSASPRIYGKRNSRRKKDEDEIIVKETAIPAIISRELWAQCNARFAVKKSQRAQYRAKSVYLLTGLVKCDLCGKIMTGDRKTNKWGTYNYYRCYGCKGNSISRDIVENYVIDGVLATFFSDDGIKKLVKKLNDYVKTLASGSSNEIKTIEKELKRIDKEIENIINAIKKGIVSETLNESLKDLEQAKKDLNEEMLTIKTHVMVNTFTENEIKKHIGEHKKLFEERNMEKCKPIIGRYVKLVTVDAEKVDIEYQLPLD